MFVASVGAHTATNLAQDPALSSTIRGLHNSATFDLDSPQRKIAGDADGAKREDTMRMDISSCTDGDAESAQCLGL
ncbi:hypothetical protein RCH16_003475 [Cryobacterium sp. MP_M5]|uniref:hypothetical protein n=1 Tax=unclassified Cryobacterium TaxID=2649013 RepID=UPI0018CABD81|nr:MULTISPECIES: hypothetical protein [unclassified Cryobacterium]MBG6060042.1 hypothetical protein [Cryobacterium sp. MP_M3]MEC5178436.1 hypothetical protein [Cryobacterium sp. MP_M5]